MKLLFVFISIGLLTALPSVTEAQILNVESLRIRSDTTGWFGEAGLGGNYIRSETKVVQADARAFVEYKALKDLIILTGNYNLLIGDDQKLVDEYLAHLRYNRKLNTWLRWEAFCQYQQNEVLLIGQRILAGTGPRFKLFDEKTFRSYLGLLVMYEHEEEKGEQALIHNDLRGSGYLSFNVALGNDLELISTTYYQPRLSGWRDYRVLHQNSLNLKAGKHFIFTVNYFLLHDSRPVAEIIRTNSKLALGFIFKIK